nr:MAG TPA: nuclease [Herelleviridae sp.]
MAVTKAQMAQWSRNYEGKYKDKKNEDSYHPAQTEPATKEQMNRWEENYQKKQNEANRVSNRMAQSRSGNGVRMATESPLQTRVQLPQGSTDTRWMGGGTRQLGTLDSKKLADEVLDSVLGTPTGSPVKTDRQEDYEPDWNYAGGDNTPQQRAQAANAVKRDDFDRWNLWMDADTRHRELVDLMRQKEQDYTSYAQSGTSRSAGGEKETKAKYTDAQLRGMGYSQQEIDTARQYLTEYPAYNPAAVFVRRGADTAKGIAATVAAAPILVGENLGVSIWNEMETRKNWKALREEVQGDARQEKLLGMLTGGKTTYAQQGSTATSMQPYTDAELLEKGYTQAEIDTMRSRIAGTKVADSADKDTLGYKLYDYGKRHTAAAQAGMTPAARTAMGVASSAAENLAVAGVSPYLVLPVLSAQGAAESMGQSVEKGQSAGRTLATGLAKFGAGWAINSVGAADLARSMGADYAKNTLAGQIADWVRGLGGDSAFAKAYPAVANALTGGVDNAVQAFVETYADTAIDAVLGGDEEAAEALLKPETFVTALQSGLTGGASGALGGAVGTGLGAMSAQIDYKAQQVQAQQQAAQLAQEYRAMEKRALEPGESAAQEQRTAEQQVDAVQAAQQVQREEAAAAQVIEDAAFEEQNPLTVPESQTVAQTVDAAPVSDNAAVQQFEQLAQAQQLTGKTIRMFAPEAGNEANRAAFEATYGVQLPDTAAATRRTLREVAAQRVQSEAAVQTVAEKALGQREETPSPLQYGDAGAAVDLHPGESLSQRNESVEKAGESVETVQPVQAGEADTTQSGALRETYGLRQQSLTEKQRSVQRELSRWKVSRGASETISRMVPDSITDLDRYTSAASCMYRLGQMEWVKTFDKALELAGSTSGLAGFTNYVLQQPGGKEALQAAWLQGQGETEAAGGLGGALSSQSTSGEGRVIWKGSLQTADEMATQLIRLNAEGTGTDAVLKSVLRGPDGTPSKRVKAYIDTETGRIFFADGNENVFATILHEDFHWYNALDAEGAKALMDRALEYLAESEGYENVDRMIRDKMQDYAAQNLTYEQAAEELVADSWSGIFETVEDMTRWAQFQRAQADKNAGKAGTITKAVNAVKQLLSSIISKAKEILTIDPENRAALHAKNLAQAQKKALQDAYFAHAEKAMDNLREAKENAAAIEGNGAAQGVRFEIRHDTDGETYIQIDEDILKGVSQENWKSVVKQAIKERFPDGFMRNGWKILNHKDGRGEFVRSKYTGLLQRTNESVYADKMRMAANLDEIIATADEVYREPANHKNAEAFNRGKIKIRVGTNAYEADVLTAIKPDTREIFYDIVNIEPTKIKPSGDTHVESEDSRSRQPESFMETSGGTHVESEDSRSRLPEVSNKSIAQDAGESKDNNEGHIKQKQESADTVFKTEEGGERPGFPAKTSIAQDAGESKENNAAVQKTVRFALSAPVEVDGQKELVAVHNLTEQNLREALQLGGMPSPSIAVVKAREGHTKYGPVSLVFGSDTIDPMVDKANRVYGADAWTPTRPGVEYEVHADKARVLNATLAQLSRQTAGGEFARGNVITGTMDMEVSRKSPQQIAEELAHSDAVKAAYLAAQGEDVDVVTKQEQRFTEEQKARSERIIEAVGGEDVLRDIVETDAKNGNHDKANAVLQAVKEAEEVNRLIPPKLYLWLKRAYEYLDAGNEPAKMVKDTDAMRQALQQKAPDAKVEQWLLPQVEKTLGRKGIYNGKEIYTRNGNRRSFAQLHNPYTLENLVNAMNQEQARGKGAWGLSARTLLSTAAAEYKTLDEVRADKDRLQQMPEAEYEKLLEDADGQIEQIVQMLRRDGGYTEREVLGEILLRAAQGKHTAAAIGKAFAKEGYVISKDAAQRVLKLYKDVAKIPTGYFEAKPQRAVGFDEVRAAILPDNASEALVQQLKDAGVPVQLYKAGDDEARTALLNKVPNVRFALAQQADREAKGSDQRQASRAIADKAAALDTLGQFFGLTRGVKVSRDSLEGLAVRWTRTNGSRADRTKLANEAQVLVEYLKAEGADMSKAQALAETLAGEVLDGATYRNSELWDEYPELHKLEYTVNKTGAAKAELVRRYGSWGEAVAEARRHGVTLRQAEGVRDGNPAEQYESIVNDVSAVGYVRDGARALWRSAAEQAGVDGALSMESTEWLDVLMNLHDAIKPKMMSRFADEAEYEDARVELAGRMLGDVMNVPEMTDAEAIFEGIMQHNMQVARAAAGTEERAAEVSRELKGIQKGQKALFREKLAQNRRDAGQHTEVQKAKANAKAEKQLNDILETQGVDITNLGDLNEKMTVLRESYERQWKEEKKRLKAERQEMLDEAQLEVKRLRSEKNELAWQLRQETRRADTAEYSLIVQENEIAEWEAESERKREAFAEKQAQRNALAIEAARQQRDEDIAVAKALAEKRVKKAREGREMDKVRKSVQRNAAALNQLVLRPSPGKYVQQSLIVQAAEVAKLANQAVLNDRALNRLTALQDSINRSMGTDSAPTAMTEDWKKSGVPVLIQTLREDMTAAKEVRLAKLHEQLTEAEALPESEKAEMLRDRLRARIRDTENRTYLPLTLEQMRMLNAITSSTLHVIRTANKTLSLAKAEEVDKIAVTAAGEVQASKGNHPGGALDGLHNLLTKYNLDMLGAERVFRMIGGYAKDGQMEKLARMLNDGQRRQTEITIEGEKKFSNVTGKEHLKEMAAFAGPGAKLVDIGLVDSKGEAVPLTHAQLCSLYMHLQNKDSVEHLMTGGMVLPDAKLYSAGDIEQAYQKGQTVQLGMLKDAEGNPMPDSVLNTVEAALTDYDRAWIADMKEFFGSYTTNLINETSMQLLGYNRAQVKNYYPIAVDKGVLATQIEGLNLDATIEGRGFLKNRVKSSKPILLEECSSVVQRSLRDTAAYAGLALPIRDVQKVLNSNVETADGLGNLKNKIIKEQWGKGTVNYINDLLTDLQTTQRRRDNGVSRMAARLRGNYAGAVLTLNPGVAIAQAASLPTAGAVLGMDTMAAVVPFVKNLSAKQRAALEAEITQHGDALLEYRKRGSQRGELASIGKDGSLAEKAMDKLPKALTGWINGMDEITVAALWEGSKAYVKNHPAEFSAEAAKAGSEEYWKAVNETYQKVIERTQPNYTVMQRAGIQRNPDEFVKAFTMFTTQRFQNYGILADAVMDYKTQSARYKAQQSAENRSEVQRAGKQLNRAVVSQVTQTAVFALMKIGADFLLHRWDREQDENGDVTLESMLKRFTALFTESAAGNFLFGSELYSAVDNAMSGKDYDVVSATNISAVNDLMGDVTKWFAECRRDTSGMTEAQLEAHEDRLHTRTFNLIEDGMEIAGVPYGNGRKLVDAVQGYWDDIQTVARGGKFSFNALPESATGQYDRLYEAYANGDTGEAQAAMEKLGAMGKEDKIYSELKKRLKLYDPDVLEAAQARNNGNDARREQLTRQIIREMYETMGIDQRAKADAAKREAVIDMVTGAVEQKGDTLLKGDSESVTDALEQALESVRAKDVQEELDRLLRAGKSLGSVKSKITAVCKPEYVAGSEYDRTQLDEMLLALRDADNNPLYTQKTLDGWVSDAEKKSKVPASDPWADLR